MLPNTLKFRRLLLYITAIAFLISQAQSKPAMLVDSYSVDSFDDSIGDPLDPSILGESMSMPLPMWMVHAAINAGIVKDSKALYAYDDGIGGYAGAYNDNSKNTDFGSSITPASKSDTTYPIEQSPQSVNVTGPWSLSLKDQVQRHLDLALVQNKDAVLGHGILDDPNGTQRVLVSGSTIGNRLAITAMLVDSLNLYKLDLSLSPNITGFYTAYSANGATWSGEVSDSAPSGVSNLAPEISNVKTEPTKETVVQGIAEPRQTSNSVSSSTSISSSSAGGANSAESYSSTSEYA